MAQSDKEKWNQKYAAGEAPQPPSAFLTGLDALLPRSGRALDVAGGAGRHALWLARRGLRVTLADISEVALQRAAGAARSEGLELETLAIDFESAPLPAGPFELILCSYYLHRPLYSSFASALAQGGLLVVAHPTRSNLEKHARPGVEYLLDDGELPRLLQGLTVVEYQEGWVESGRHEARLVARR